MTEPMEHEELTLSGETVTADRLLTERGSETLREAIQSNEFFNWALQNRSLLTQVLSVALALNLAPFGLVGREVFMKASGLDGSEASKGNDRFDRALTNWKNGEPPTSYSLLLHWGFATADGERIGSPAADVLALRQKLDRQLRGFTVDKKGRTHFNPNVFVKYALTRVKLVLCNGVYYIYDNTGVYHEISTAKVSKLFRLIMHEAQDDMWRVGYADQYLEALPLQVQQVPEMNPSRNLLNLVNCMLDINTGQPSEHSPKLLSTIRIPIEYNPASACPRFLRFLNEVTLGDAELQSVLQEIMGWLLTSDTRAQKAFYLVGDGANGKSVFAEVVRHLCGVQNVSTVSLSQLGGRFGLQSLPGKTVNISTENEFTGKQIDTEAFKAIVGGDAVNIERKYMESYSAKLNVKLLVLLNNLPPTYDLSHGFFRRLLFVPFRRTFSAAQADRGLLDKLLAELPGILNFALVGLRRLVANGYNFTVAKASEEALGSYLRAQNPVLDFCTELVRSHLGSSIKRADIQQVFVRWCQANGNLDWTRVTSQRFLSLFRGALAQRGIAYREKKIRGIMYLDGVALLTFGEESREQGQT